MRRSAESSTVTGDVDGVHIEPREPWVLAIEIDFYGHDAPITIPLPDVQVATAQAYFERARSDVIEAQRHNDRRVAIGPFGQARDVLVLDPATIKGVVLIDEPSPPARTADSRQHPRR